MRAIRLRPVWWLVAAVWVMPCEGRAQDPAAPTSRPDSLRAFVLDRLRELGAEPDTVPPDPLQGPAGAANAEAGAGLPPVPRAQAPEGADPLMRDLLELQGFSVATYEGIRADFQVPERTLVLEGDSLREATFSGQGIQLVADTAITYDDLVGRIRTMGQTQFSRDAGEPVTSRVLIYSLGEGRGTALGAETTYNEGGPWIVRGDLDSIQQGLLFGSTTAFTSCLLPEPHTFFQASRLKVVGGQVLVARSVTMYVADVPVFWLPFLAQNLGTGRASGLLTPVFSMNDIVRTSAGYERRISNLGYYWAMTDYTDLTVAMDWFSNNYTAGEARMGYRWARQFLSGSLNLKRFWSESGKRDLAVSTQHDWRMSERSAFRASGRYVSSSVFLRRNSFDPRETTQTIDSDASLNRRFDWGTANVGASRKQYLSDDRVDMTLPSASASLSTLTLFDAPPQTASWYNNLSVSGSSKLTRRVLDRSILPDTAFSLRSTSQIRTDAGIGGSLGLGDFSLSANVSTARDVFQDVPDTLIVTVPDGGEVRRERITWSTSLSYRQHLIGSTTLNPNVTLSGTLLQFDSIPQAADAAAAPVRVSVGVGLHTDLYGFYPGFGPFEAVRHKITPNARWSYSPQVQPTERQIAVFGSGALARSSVMTFGVNQTWEARLTEEAAAEIQPPPAAPGDSLAAAVDSLGVPGADTGGVAVGPATSVPQEAVDGGATRLPPSRVVNLLSLRTTALAYDLVRADSTGRFLDGFTTTTIRNDVGSDYLRGLSLSFSHNLFEEPGQDGQGGRKFRPQLSQLSMSFSLSERSAIVRAIARLFGADPPPPGAEPEPPPPDATGVDESYLQPAAFGQVIPSGPDSAEPPPRREGWDTQVNYSFRRPRSSTLGNASRAQMISASMSFAPTQNWTAQWSTSYDVEAGRFNDQRVRLQRDLHEWQASFGFFQTPTGNWSFTFEISLRANQDLHFDYEQRSLQGVQQGF